LEETRIREEEEMLSKALEASKHDMGGSPVVYEDIERDISMGVQLSEANYEVEKRRCSSLDPHPNPKLRGREETDTGRGIRI